MTILGVRATPEYERLERSRVERARRIAQIDRLGLRYRLPAGMDSLVRSGLRRRRTGDSAAQAFTSRDLWTTPDELPDALDLLAVARVAKEI